MRIRPVDCMRDEMERMGTPTLPNDELTQLADLVALRVAGLVLEGLLVRLGEMIAREVAKAVAAERQVEPMPELEVVLNAAHRQFLKSPWSLSELARAGIVPATRKRTIGQALGRLVDGPSGGVLGALQVHRVAEDRHGVIWRVEAWRP